MKNLFWRIVLSFKYWRTVMPRLSSFLTLPKFKIKPTGWVALFLMLLFPVLFGGGFGYLSWVHGERLSAQYAVDLDGVEISAKIVGLEIEKIVHSSTRLGNGERTRPEPSYFCHILVSYSATSPDRTMRKLFILEDETICKRYKAGDFIAGKMLPDDPEIMILDEGRLETFWFWITFGLFNLFTVIPSFYLLRGFFRMRSRIAHGEEPF